MFSYRPRKGKRKTAHYLTISQRRPQELPHQFVVGRAHFSAGSAEAYAAMVEQGEAVPHDKRAFQIVRHDDGSEAQTLLQAASALVQTCLHRADQS